MKVILSVTEIKEACASYLEHDVRPEVKDVTLEEAFKQFGTSLEELAPRNETVTVSVDNDDYIIEYNGLDPHVLHRICTLPQIIYYMKHPKEDRYK